MNHTVIDYDVPLADYSPSFESLESRVAAALATLSDTDAFPDAIDEADKAMSRSIFIGERLASDNDLSRPGVLTHIGALLNEYDRTVVKSAAQLRTYITNRLILETDSPDPRVRLKALEMLGKVSDVGLFTDKTEITMRHRPTEELEQLLRERLTRVIEAEVSQPAPAASKNATEIDFSELKTDDGTPK